MNERKKNEDKQMKKNFWRGRKFNRKKKKKKSKIEQAKAEKDKEKRRKFYIKYNKLKEESIYSWERAVISIKTRKKAERNNKKLFKTDK